MTTADWAIVISIGSLLLAIASFVWNVWSKFIYPKPKIRASISVMNIFQGGKLSRPFISLHATNFGPADIKLHAAVARGSRGWFRRKSYAYLNPLEGSPDVSERSSGPFSGGLPKKLAIGESFAVYFPIKNEWFTDQNNLCDFGFLDTFGRHHWCPSSQIRTLKERITNGPDQQSS